MKPDEEWAKEGRTNHLDDAYMQKKAKDKPSLHRVFYPSGQKHLMPL
jgi:hypothetical protein